MLADETLAEIASMVRSGFYDRQRLVEVFTEEMYAPGELPVNDVVAAIDEQLAAYAEESLSYPASTDCDRLDSAFVQINIRGVVAIQNAGYTQSEGYEDVGDAYNRHPDKESILGYCFYHGQDLQRALNGDGLYLAFGPVDPAKEQTVGVEAGNIVCEELENTGLSVDWNGTFDTRICVPKLVWQKRIGSSQ